jgi:Ca-activated chloride channel family protein
VLVYPHEGVSTADYPLMLLNERRRDDYQKVVAYLKGEAAQTWLAADAAPAVCTEVARRRADILPARRCASSCRSRPTARWPTA